MDKERVYPVRRLTLHHSTGSFFKYFDQLTVQDYFDDCGRGWGYKHYCDKYGYNINDYHTGHMHPARDKETFSQAHFALHEGRHGWSLVPLIRDPYNCVAWGTDQYCGKVFDIGQANRESIILEVCGDYTKLTLPDAALKVIVAGFVDVAKAVTRQGVLWLVDGHKDHALTTCPGMIYTQLPRLREMFSDAMLK